MKLSQYLKMKNISTAEAARQLGVTRQHLGLIKKEKLPAGRKLSIKLFQWSSGEIGITEHMMPDFNVVTIGNNVKKK